MPLYDYRCDDCGDFRAFRAMKDSHLPQACPQCAVDCLRTLVAPYLSGGQAEGWLGRQQGQAGGSGSWRKMCGFGCSHAGCG